MIISITSSKGGVGKTALTNILCCEFFNHHNLDVALIDLDPQESSVLRRANEVKEVNTGEADLRVKKQLIKNQESKGKYFYPIVKIDLDTKNRSFEEIANQVKDLESKVDVLFLDFPGSLVLNETILRLMSLLDHIFIPLYPDYNSTSSLAKFLNGIRQNQKSGSFKMDSHIFFNRFSKVSNTSNFNSVKEVLSPLLDKRNTFMDNKVYQSIAIDRYSTISSYNGPHKIDIRALSEEMEHIIFNKD